MEATTHVQGGMIVNATCYYERIKANVHYSSGQYGGTKILSGDKCYTPVDKLPYCDTGFEQKKQQMPKSGKTKCHEILSKIL